MFRNSELLKNKSLLLLIVLVIAFIAGVVYFSRGNDSRLISSNGNSGDVSNLSSLSNGQERHISRNPMSARVIAAGVNHTCAIDFSRKVFCWGGANKGSLGDDGSMRNCEVEDGSKGLACEYRNPNLETTKYSFTPVSVFKGEAKNEGDYLGDAKLLAVGDLFACAVVGKDSEAYCWGKGSSGQLGNGKRADQAKPVAVCGEGYTSDCKSHVLKNVVAIAAGGEHACAIVGDKKQVYCWGNGGNGRLGNNSSDYQLTPVAVCAPGEKDCNAHPLVDARTIEAGTYLTCATQGEEKLGLCWGDGSSNQLGNNNQDSYQSIPTPICAPDASDCQESPLKGVIKIAIGQSHTCAIAGNEKIAYCWGQARYGQLGNNNDIENMKTPSAVCLPGTSDDEKDWDCTHEPEKIVKGITDIDAGYVHTCAIFSQDRRAYCWGESFFGRLGDNGTHNQKVPVPVYNGYDKDGYAIEDEGFLWLTNVESLSLGSNYSCATLMEDNIIKCWGNNQLGQLGDKERVNMLIPSIVGF